jgi:riboflavin synthase
MFTGIIEDVGLITAIARQSGKWEFRIRTPLAGKGVANGDSVAIDGVCLTATKIAADSFCADASLETLRVTTLQEKKIGQKVNVERAMTAEGRFGGHMVMGHVDGIGTIVDLKKAGDSLAIQVEIPASLMRYVIRKGSVAIDGISLTVNDLRDNIFSVNVIPYTASHTTVMGKNVRDRVNIETDIIGKYVERFVEKDRPKGFDLNFLYQHGYVKGE